MYRNADQKLEFTPRIRAVEQAIRPRLREWKPRENTLIDPVPLEGRNPFADVFEEMPDAPYRMSSRWPTASCAPGW